MLSKKNTPNLENLEITHRIDGNHRYIQAKHENRNYEVRIPMHIWGMIEQDSSDAAWHLEPYVRGLMANIARGRHTGISD